MRLLARLSCLAVALFMAGGVVATTVVSPETSPGMIASDQKGAAHEQLPLRESEKPEAVSADPSSGDGGGASRETNRLADQEKAPRDGMFLLLLQILRSPK